MQEYINAINELWSTKDNLQANDTNHINAHNIVTDVINLLDQGKIVVSYKEGNKWQVNEWVKKAILLYFRLQNMKFYDGHFTGWYDKIDPKFVTQEQLSSSGSRIVPGAYIRYGAFLGKDTVIMPSFINIGAYIGNGTLIDTWSTIGSCAHIGKNCHISGGVGIGGVLEPLQATPVIIEDNCFIGARSEIAEGIIIEEGAVISMGVFLNASTKIVYRHSGKIIYGKVPAYSVVVPGFLPSETNNLPGMSCAVIVKQVDEKTRSKTSINELLRQ
ncbi:MAG: 2,3,4,5-tetrahydropyridine-2,6-dicarboxylate N-succinyltransferase [Rickettsiaceae bacterium]|nr:2,3,4,5-tetrahydropyridine-2,6-dicarboxylate N-succinyltransferase [Rickettsiaceae bacterium]